MSAKSAKPPQKPPLRAGLKREIISIVLIFFSLFLIFSLFGGGGALGSGLSSLFMGFLGVGAFILPFLVAGFAALMLLNRHKDIGLSRILMGVSLYIIFVSLIHMVGFSRPEDMTFLEYLGHSFSYGTWSNGGVFGALISGMFVSLIGRIVTLILFIALGAILFITITGKSIFAMMQASYEKAKIRAEENKGKKEEQEELERKYQEEQQAARPIPTYTNDTSVYTPVAKRGHDRIVEDAPKTEDAPIHLAKKDTETRTAATAIPTPIPVRNVINIEDEKPLHEVYGQPEPKINILEHDPEPYEEIVTFEELMAEPEPAPEPEPEIVHEPEPEPAFSIKGMIEGAEEVSFDDEPVTEALEDDTPPWELAEIPMPVPFPSPAPAPPLASR
ncbi:MAG: DNA translocase FtsK 4TM domain-containing protein, partial [Defluviitaleaceae bacterium]|nr:DNA translocase FtsK 4TM domain-containing protein [Defluviitaleaceae bacterium]